MAHNFSEDEPRPERYLPGEAQTYEAIKNDDTAKLSDVLNNGVPADPLLFISVLEGALKTTELLIMRGANINAHNGQAIGRKTPAHFAVTSGKRDVLALLLQHKADITKRDIHGRNPAYYARDYGKAVDGYVRGCGDITALLIEHKAEIPPSNIPKGFQTATRRR